MVASSRQRSIGARVKQPPPTPGDEERPVGRLELAPAPIVLRVGAWVIDFFVFLALSFFLGSIASVFSNTTVPVWSDIAAYILLVAIPLTAIRGQTIGQFALGLAVVDVNGQRPPGVGRAAAHVALSLLLAPIEGLLFSGLAIVAPGSAIPESKAEAGVAALAAMEGRQLHDRLAGTVVLNIRHHVSDWQSWGRRHYRDRTIAAAAARAAASSIASGSSAADAEISGYRAAVQAGGEYRCVPDRTGTWIALWVVIGVAFGSLTVLGLAYNGPSPGGLVILALVTVGPALATAPPLLTSINSGHYLTRDKVGRRDWLRRTVACFPRADVVSTNLIPAHQETSLSALGFAWAEFEVKHPQLYPVRGLKAWYLPESRIPDSQQSELSAWLFWWSERRFRELQSVFDDRADSVGRNHSRAR